MNTLEKICADKHAHIAKRKKEILLSELERQAHEQSPPRGFYRVLKEKIDKREIGLIAEIKKASPSQGVIRPDFDPAALAKAYETGGATCLSVLTDEPYFQGKDEDLMHARQAVSLPVLRKDFILDPYQIAESRAIGADCILLIVAALEVTQMQELEAAAYSYKIDVLVEVHDDKELEIALMHLKSPLLGINNRNLKTLAVDLETTKRLAPKVFASHTLVCESGITTYEDIQMMQTYGVHSFLVGESLMRQPDVTAAVHRLLGQAS